MKNTKKIYKAPKAEKVEIDKGITVSMMSIPPSDPFSLESDSSPFKF